MTEWRKLKREALDFYRSERFDRALMVAVCVLFAAVLLWQISGEGLDLSAFAAMISALIALVAVHQGRQSLDVGKASVDEAREARLAQSRPQVLVSFEVEGGTIYAVIGHYGGGPARNVRFAFKPPLTNDAGDDIGAKPPFVTGIAMMVPGHRQRVAFADLSEYRLHWLIDESPEGIIERPSKFALTIKLNDPLANDREYVTTYVLDVEHLLEAVRSPWEALTPDNPRYESTMRLFGLNQPATDAAGPETGEPGTDDGERDQTEEVEPDQDAEG